eukprot:6650747-Pyramimonas_sp.AAC.1
MAGSRPKQRGTTEQRWRTAATSQNPFVSESSRCRRDVTRLDNTVRHQQHSLDVCRERALAHGTQDER